MLTELLPYLSSRELKGKEPPLRVIVEACKRTVTELKDSVLPSTCSRETMQAAGRCAATADRFTQGIGTLLQERSRYS